MTQPVLLWFDPAEEEMVREKVAPRIEAALEAPVTALACTGAALPEAAEGQRVVTWLDDHALESVVAAAAERGFTVAPLPHPGLAQARLGFGIASKLDDAVADLSERPEGSWVDLLLCNGRPVFNSVVIADASSLAPGASLAGGLRARLARFFALLGRLGRLRLRPVALVTQKEKTLETAALGIVVVQHGRSSLLSRLVLEDSAINDGMLHALVLAPRSVMAMVRWLLRSLFAGRRARGRLPAFAGHVRTASLAVKSPAPLEYLHDGREMSAKEIELRVVPRALRVVLGRHLAIEEQGPEAKESFRVQSLPAGEARSELLERPLPWAAHAATEEFKDLFQALRENARRSEAYLVLVTLSTLLATFGLFANSTPVIIGAMVLAPLMAPIISLAMGVLRQEAHLLKESARTLAVGTGLALAASIALTWITPLQTINSEIAARLSPTLLDLGVAVVSGMAGAYAHARAEVARSLAGVAIAVALVPPLAVAGIGIGWADWAVFSGAFLLYLTNLAGMVLAAALTFSWLGYSPFRLARRGLLTSLAIVAGVSVPLVVSSVRMVEEHRAIGVLEGWETQAITLHDVHVLPGDPWRLNVRLLSPEPIDAPALDRVKVAVEARLGRPIVLEASTSVLR